LMIDDVNYRSCRAWGAIADVRVKIGRV